MTELVYAIIINKLNYSGLKVLDVKIGKTTNINSTLNQYRRSSRIVEILDLWEPNKNLFLSECERGVQKLAEKYAHERKSEKFIFLQDSYDNFSNNVSLMLKKVSENEITEVKKVKRYEPEIKGIDFQSEIHRDDLKGSDDDLVALFPTRLDGIEFLKKYNAWGYVKMNKIPKYLAFFVTRPYSQILFVAEFSHISKPFYDKKEIKDIDDADKDSFSPGKSIVYLKKESLSKLSNPIPYKSPKGFVPFGLSYTTLGKIKRAKDTDHFRKTAHF